MGDVVNLFQVLRSKQGAELIEQLRLTPFARTEFIGSYQETDEPVERARRLVIRSFMGFGSDGHNRKTRTGFRANSNRSGTTPAHDWANYPDALPRIIERLQGVVIEQRLAIEVCRQHDGPKTLHYLDPPYMWTTRSGKSRKSGEPYHAYAHEMTADDHAALLDWASALVGMVMISGYSAALYDEALSSWQKVETASLADGALKRTECLWLNPACSLALRAGPLFEETLA